MSMKCCAVLATVTVLSLVGGSDASGQELIDVYLDAAGGTLRKELTQAATSAKDSSDKLDAIRNLLPHSSPNAFAEMLKASRGLAAELLALDPQRLDKMLAGNPGQGGTALLSKGAAPRVLSAAVEYGSIFQANTPTTTTLRGNLLGVGRLLFGTEQFPDCPIDAGCSRLLAALRSISGSVGFEPVKTPGDAVTVAIEDVVTPAQLLSDDYRMTSWSLRVDLTSKDNLQSPEYIAAWASALTALGQSPAVQELSQAALNATNALIALPEYTDWRNGTEAELIQASTADELRRILARRMELLGNVIDAAGLDLSADLIGVVRATAQLNEARNQLLRAMHSNRSSVEVTSYQPLEQPAFWNARFVYSHQPTGAPALMTINVGASWYDEKLVNSSRFRDIQVAGQIDRKLGDLASLGRAVLSLAGYVQWLKDDAVVTLGPDNVAPDSTIVLPTGAATVLGTKGVIGVLQGRLAVSLNDTVKVPLSVTWASRRELVNEDRSAFRGQVGLSLDLDQLFR